MAEQNWDRIAEEFFSGHPSEESVRVVVELVIRELQKAGLKEGDAADEAPGIVAELIGAVSVAETPHFPLLVRLLVRRKTRAHRGQSSVWEWLVEPREPAAADWFERNEIRETIITTLARWMRGDRKKLDYLEELASVGREGSLGRLAKGPLAKSLVQYLLKTLEDRDVPLPSSLSRIVGSLADYLDPEAVREVADLAGIESEEVLSYSEASVATEREIPSSPSFSQFLSDCASDLYPVVTRDFVGDLVEAEWSRISFSFEEADRQAVASQIWQVILQTDAFRRLPYTLEGPAFHERDEPFFFARSERGSYHVGIFSSCESEDVTKRSFRVSEDDFRQAVQRWEANLRDALSGTERDASQDHWQYQAGVGRLVADALSGSSWKRNRLARLLENPIDILSLSRPRTERTCAPSPPHEVSGRQVSTAGARAENSSGILGVTAALHSIGSGASPTVDSHDAAIVSEDAVTDSCFLHADDLDVPEKLFGTRGPLRGRVPAVGSICHFHGVNSGLTECEISACHLEIPNVQPGTQARIYTDPCTNLGDSGAALVDQDDYILGFAYERSGAGERRTFSSWIWAASVFDVHDLTPA